LQRRNISDDFFLFFPDGWDSRWVKSDWKKDENLAGEWNHTSGKWNGNPEDKGTFFALLLLVPVMYVPIFCKM
jgi:hypothetical protein